MTGFKTAINIIILEDDEQDIFFLKEILFASTILIDQLITIKKLSEINDVLKTSHIDVILYGLRLSSDNGLEDLLALQKSAQQIPVILLVSGADEGAALEAIRNGAQDFLFKHSLDENILRKSILCSIERKHNITNKRISEEAIKSSEEKYRNLFNNNPAAIFIWDPSYMTFLEVNDAAIKRYEYTREEFLQLNVLDISFEEERLKMKQLSANILQKEKFKSIGTWTHVTKTGTRLYMNVSFQGIDYYGKKASLAIAFNITEQVELEIKLASERFKKQQEITAAVIIAQEQEREQLGRELHDNINQILATTRLYIEYAQAHEDSRDDFLNNAKAFIIKAVREIRNLSKSLLPPSLGEIGLVMAVEEMVNAIQQVHECNFNVEWIHFEEKLLSEQLKLTIFRIIQEQLNNIITHAHAKNVWIKIAYQNTSLSIAVKDDGVGFNMANKSKGVGFKNITSRAGLYNGMVHLHSEKGKGCELKVSFHLDKK